MREEKYQNHNKVYVKVEALFHPDGRLTPVALWWENGCRYTIDRVVDICRAASLKAGGIGMRYTCTVQGRQIYLFYEEDRWFMERLEA
ncbi:MAG: hypothetical protein KGZ41_01265 [Dethiobacter sp.]|jgi:hypothetical protein|nr:hypothetical protein [Dethiobacter sp.]MBS3899520.1 hypothetical protein [Dethiobacter sp.]MBS3982408.1 hypothetical protein [Dethiobacter sp.]MCL4463583.1 hypothetical protein [Bacillota bacterium]MCL5994181.1 hypothetical protein [Bacillota bacterium]